MLTCRYRTTDADFEETFAFHVPHDADEALARAFDALAVTAGVSYYKTVASHDLHLFTHASTAWHDYVTDLYDRGMREFRFQNGLDLAWEPRITFTEARDAQKPSERTGEGDLVTMGGGRDSLLVASMLKPRHPTLMTVGHNPIVTLQADQLGLELCEVDRTIDPKLFDLNRRGALNGHVPVTAINSCVAIVLALLLGRKHVVLSNERSASQPTRVVRGMDVNHQYSKSWDFERQLRSLLDSLEVPVVYFSALRHLGELDISERLAQQWDSLPPFVSCNKGRTRENLSGVPTWCTRCAKCYFVYLALAPYVARSALVDFFGRDVLAEPADGEAVERLLLGPNRDFECIGTAEETAFALTSAYRGDWNDVPWLGRLIERLDVTAVPQFAGAAEHAIPPEFRPLLGAP